MSSSPCVGGGCSAPVAPEEVEKWFDCDGRLVKEAAMRKALFEVGVAPSCRSKIFKFLYNVYPTISTTRDRKTIDIENRAHYIALRRRWEVMDQTITFPDEDLLDRPWYMDFSEDEDDDSNSRPPPPPPPGPSVEDRKKEGQSCGAKLTESRDSGNFTEASLETSSEVSCGLCVTDTCSSCGRTLQRGVAEGGVATAVEDGVDKTPTARRKNLRADECEEESQGTCDNKCEQCNSFGDGGNSDPYSDWVNIPSPGSTTGCGCGRDRRRSTSGILNQEGQALLAILEFPSKVYAARLPVELEKSYTKAKRTILKDVSRTDRNYHFFSHKRNLRKVHRILMIYSLFHPEMGYAQGMNDILARFLVITESEVDSYWLFKLYMDKKREDFLEDTMMRKVGLVKNLIMELDSKLYDFLESSECRDYLFCHRWLLLDFKREFPFEESLRIFEVLSSHYLELNSDKARVETDKVIAKEFELDGGEMRSNSSVNLGFTFDLFVCAAILTMSSSIVSKGTDAASVYGFLNSLSMNLDLKKVLTQAEELFYTYCKLTVTRGFNEIEL